MTLNGQYCPFNVILVEVKEVEEVSLTFKYKIFLLIDNIYVLLMKEHNNSKFKIVEFKKKVS